MNEAMEKTLLDLKARQLRGERHPCPRCGRDVMSDKPVRNALSRSADVYVCDECGTDEALLAMMQNPLPLKQWACFRQEQKPPEDLSGLTMRVLWTRISKEHIAFLTTLFERWLDEHKYEDFDEFRDAAKRRCPGLTELWDAPFHARYKAADGEIVVRFKSTAEGIEVAGDMISKRGG